MAKPDGSEAAEALSGKNLAAVDAKQLSDASREGEMPVHEDLTAEQLCHASQEGDVGAVEDTPDCARKVLDGDTNVSIKHPDEVMVDAAAEKSESLSLQIPPFAQSDGTEPGMAAEKAHRSSTVPNEVFASQSGSKIAATSTDQRPAERKQNQRHRKRTMAAPDAVEMPTTPPAEPDVYVPVSSKVEIAQFTHAAPSAAPDVETENAGSVHFRGRLTPAGKTDTLQQQPQHMGASRMICADTPMRRGTQSADFGLRVSTHAVKMQELFRFIESKHDGMLTRRELQAKLIHPHDDLKRHVEEVGLSAWLSENEELFEHLTTPQDGPIKENEFVEHCEHIVIGAMASAKLPRFLVGVSVVQTKGGVQTATGRHVSFCLDRSQLIVTAADGKEESFPCNLPAGAKLLHPQKHPIGVTVEFKRRDQVKLSIIIGHDSVSLPMSVDLSPGEWLCWSAQVSAAKSELAKDEVTISAGRWRAQNCVRIGSEVCVAQSHINVLGTSDCPFILSDDETLIATTVEENGDMRVSGRTEAVWHTFRVSKELPQGTHYAEFQVATDPRQSGTGRSWMVGVARPTGNICSAMHSYTRDDIWAFAGGDARQGGGKLNRGFHAVDPTIRALVTEAVNSATGSNGGYRGSPAYRELDARAADLQCVIKQHRTDEKEAAVHDNDAARALELRRQAEVAEQHLGLLRAQMDDQKRKDMSTLMHWESLENRIAQLVKRRHDMTSAGIYDCQVVIPLQTLLQESDQRQQERNAEVEALTKIESGEACTANLYTTAAGAIEKLLRRVEDRRVAARTQFDRVKEITVGGVDSVVVNGTYLPAEHYRAISSTSTQVVKLQKGTVTYVAAERYRVLSRSAIYNTSASSCTEHGNLEEGTVIEGMSTKKVDGVERVQFNRGWVSMTGRSGEPLLEKLQEEMPWGPCFINQNGFYLYYHYTINRWIINRTDKSYISSTASGITPEYIAMAEAQHGLLPTGSSTWKCQLENSQQTKLKLTVGIFPPPPPALNAKEDSPQTSQLRSSFVRAGDSNWSDYGIDTDGSGKDFELAGAGSLCKLFRVVAREDQTYTFKLHGDVTVDTELVLVSPDRQNIVAGAHGCDPDKSDSQLDSDAAPLSVPGLELSWTCSNDGVYHVIITHVIKREGGSAAKFNLCAERESTAGTAEAEAMQQVLASWAGAAETTLNGAASEHLDDHLCALYDKAIVQGVGESKLDKVVKRTTIDKHIEELREERDTICRQLKPVLDELAASDEVWEEKVRHSGGRQASGSWDGMKIAKPGDVLGLLLDLPPDGPNTGSLRIYKNGNFLGTIATGLHGDLCWCATLCDGEHVIARRNPKYFPSKKLKKLSEVRPWSDALYEYDNEFKRLQLDAKTDAQEGTMMQVAKSKESERKQWITRAQEADCSNRRLKLAQHFYHRPNMSVGHSIACLHGTEYSNVTLTEMQDICTKLQPDTPIGFMFQAKSGDAEGRGTGQLLTSEALKDSNYRRVSEHFYATKHLDGATIDRKEYTLSNLEAMKAAVAHCRVIKADGFHFFAQDKLPNRNVTCFFKRRLLSEVSQSITIEDFNAADAIVMDQMLSKGLIRPAALEFWTGVYDRVVVDESAESAGRSSVSKEDIIKSICDEKIVTDEQLERVFPKTLVAELRTADQLNIKKKFEKSFELIDTPKMNLAQFVSAMARQEVELNQNHKKNKKKTISSAQRDSWTDQDRLEVQKRLYSPRSSSGNRYSVAGLGTSDTILLETVPSPQRRRLTAAFRRIDGSRNGAVTKNELVKGLSDERDLLGLIVPDVQRFLAGNYESQMQAFKFIDGDGSRTLGCTEFVLQMVKQQMTRAEEAERAMMLSAESEAGDWHAYTVRPEQDGVYLWTDIPGSLPPLIVQLQAPRMAETLAQTQKINPKYDAHNQLKYPYAFGSSAPTHWMRHEVATGQRIKSGPEITVELPPTADHDQATATDLPVFKKKHDTMTGHTARVVESVPDLMRNMNLDLRPGLILYSVQDEPAQGMAPGRYKTLTQQRPLRLGFVSAWEKLSTARPVTAQRANKDRTNFKVTSFKAKYEWVPNRKEQMVWAKPQDLDEVDLPSPTTEDSPEKLDQAIKQRKKKAAAKNKSRGVYPVGTKESTPQPSPRYKRIQMAGQGADHRTIPAADRYDPKPSSWWKRDALDSAPTEQDANLRFRPCSGETGRDGGEAFKQWTARFKAAPPQKAPAAAHKIPEHRKRDKVAVPPTPRGFGSTVATYRGTQSPFVPWSKQQMSRAMLAEWQQSQQAHIDFSCVRIKVMGSALPLPKYRYEGQPNKDAKWAAFSRIETEKLEEAIFDAIDDGGTKAPKTRMACRQSSFGSSLVVHWPELEQDQTREISQHEWKFYMSAIHRKLGREYGDFVIKLAHESAVGDEFDFGTELAGLLCQIDARRGSGISWENFAKLYSEGDGAAMEMVPRRLEELSERLQVSFVELVNQLHVTGNKTESLRDMLQRLMKTRVCKLFSEWPAAPSKVQHLSQVAAGDLFRDGGTNSKTFRGVIEQPTSLKGVQVLANKEATTTCCGEYKFAGMRNGRPCFNRVDAKPGALYFDGSYWKLTNEGAARTEIQWNYSQMQNPTSPVPPLGSWSAQAAKGGSTEADYGKLRLKVVAGQEVLRPKSEIPTDVPRVGNIGVDFATWKQSEKYERDVTMRQLVSPRNWATGVPASLTFVTSLDAKEGLRPTRIEYSHGMTSVQKVKVEREKFGFGSHAPTYRGDSAGAGMLAAQYVGLGDLWYTLTPRAKAPDNNQAPPPHHQTHTSKSATSPRRQRPKSAPLQRSVRGTPRHVTWVEQLNEPTGSVSGEFAGGSPQTFTQTAAKYQVAVPPALTNKILPKKAVPVKPPAPSAPIVSNDEQIVRLKALQEVKHLTDSLERGLHRGQADLKAELQKLTKGQRQDRQQNMLGTHEFIKAELDARIYHLQQGWETHAQAVQTGVNELKSELKAWGAGTRHAISGVEESAAAAIKAVEGTHAKMLRERWETMESELERQRKEFEREIQKLQEQLARTEKARVDQMEASLNGIAKSITDGLDEGAHRLDHQPGTQSDKSPSVRDTKPAEPQSEVHWAAQPPVAARPATQPMKRSMQQPASKPEGAIGSDAMYVAREPWSAGRSTLAAGRTGATTITTTPHTPARLDVNDQRIAHAVAHESLLAESQEHGRAATSASQPMHPQPPPASGGVHPDAESADLSTSRTIGEMIGLLKVELALADTLSVPAAVAEASMMLECTFPDGTPLRKKVQLLCDECGIGSSLNAAARPVPFLAPGPVLPVKPSANSAQPTVEALLNDAVSRLEALAEYPGQRPLAGTQQILPTAVSLAKIDKHIEQVTQHPPLKKAVQVDMEVDATDHHLLSDKSQEEKIALAVAEGVKNSFEDGLFEAGWQRQEHLRAIRSEIDAVRQDAEANVAQEMMKMRMEARQKAQDERERNMRRSLDAVNAQREKALAEREAELNAKARDAALARREALLAAAEQRTHLAAAAAATQHAPTAPVGLPQVAAATPRPPSQPTTPPSEEMGTAPHADQAGPRKRRDALFEHLNLLKGLKMRGLLDESEYEKRKHSILDKYEAAGSQLVK